MVELLQATLCNCAGSIDDLLGCGESGQGWARDGDYHRGLHPQAGHAACHQQGEKICRIPTNCLYLKNKTDASAQLSPMNL